MLKQSRSWPICGVLVSAPGATTWKDLVHQALAIGKQGGSLNPP